MTDATQTRRQYNGAAQVADTPLGPGARQPGKGKGGLVPAQRAGSVLGALTTCDYGTPTITPVSSAPGQHRQGEPQTAYNTFIMSMLEIFLRRVTPALPPGSDAAALAYLWPRPRPVGPWLAPEVCGLCPQWGGGCCAAQGVHSRRDCGTIAFEFPILHARTPRSRVITPGQGHHARPRASRQVKGNGKSVIELRDLGRRQSAYIIGEDGFGCSRCYLKPLVKINLYYQ